MITILNDPTGALGSQRYAWNYGLTIQQNIELHMKSGAGAKLLFNGIEVDPLTEPRLDAAPCIADFVTVVRRPEGLETIFYVVLAALVVVSYALMPKPPGVAGTGKDSPNNSLTGQSNVARTYQAIPDVYGYRRVWPDLIQPSTVEYIDQIKYVTEWMCISRGRGTISSVQYAETPLGDIEGASYEVFTPAPSAGYAEFSTTTLVDVLETFASEEVNGQELEYPVAFPAVVTTGSFAALLGATTFTVTVPDAPSLDRLKVLVPSGSAAVSFSYGTDENFSAACLVLGVSVAFGNATFTFSSLPWAADTTRAGVLFTLHPLGQESSTLGPYTLPLDGQRLRWNTVFLRGLKGAVTIRAEWWKVDGAGVELAGTRQHQDNTYTANTYDQRFYTNDATPAAGTGRYRVQFTRTSLQIGDGGADVAKLEELYVVRHYAEKVLPGVTVLRVTTKATIEATGFSDRKFNLRWLRHVRSLTSDAVSESRNFARSIAHIWTLAGNNLDELDTDKLSAINAELGEASPLLSFDMSLDDADMSLGERMQLVADAARCVVWRDGTKWTVTRDQARAYPELQLDYRNLASGGDSSISYAAHLPASNDGVEVEYVDEASQSKKAYVRLDISSGAVVPGLSGNPKKIKQPGSTTLAQATNRAQLEARRLLYQRVSVSDTAMSDGGSLGRGALVRWVDPNDFAGDDGLQAGEVLAIAGNVIRTSEPIDWKGETQGRVQFTGADGSYLGPPVLCYPDASGVRVPGAPAGIYTAGGNRQLGSRYAFAVGLTVAEMEDSGLYTVTDIRATDKSNCSVALIEYDERIYEADA